MSTRSAQVLGAPMLKSGAAEDIAKFRDELETYLNSFKRDSDARRVKGLIDTKALGFLAKALDRPANERAFLLIPVGYPADECQVPALARKGLDEILVRY